LNTDALIDAFVRKINHSPRRRIREEDVPHPLREGGAEFGLYYHWTIQRFDRINWIAPLEEKLPRPLPPSYKSLVNRYIFPAFEIDSLILLANTGKTLYHEMYMAMANDAVTSQVLLDKGYAQFALPQSADSDPVCFDLKADGAEGECPIVRISHTDIVVSSKVRVMEKIAPSFLQFVDQYVRVDPNHVKVKTPRP
jgi:hypothetical protein